MSSSLAYQMNDFQNSIDDFKKKFDDIYFCSEEIVNDYDNGKFFYNLKFIKTLLIRVLLISFYQ